MSNKTIIFGANTVNPLTARTPGYGTMRLTGEDVWGEPQDRRGAISLLRRAIELGVNFFDTADFYGPGVTNRLLVEALYPYPADIIIATKVGGTRGSDKSWLPYAKPSELRASVENNLKELRLTQLPLVHFGKAGGSSGEYEDSLETMFKLQEEGKILHVGLTNVTVDQFKLAITKDKIASVENLYSYAQRVTDPANSYGMRGGEVLPLCEEHKIPFIPYFSLQTSLPVGQDRMKELAEAKHITTAQLNIAWLLHKSTFMLPIPGTTSIKHLEENTNAADIVLSKEEMDFLG